MFYLKVSSSKRGGFYLLEIPQQAKGDQIILGLPQVSTVVSQLKQIDSDLTVIYARNVIEKTSIQVDLKITFRNYGSVLCRLKLMSHIASALFSKNTFL